jgi:cytochrome c551/c552
MIGGTGAANRGRAFGAALAFAAALAAPALADQAKDGEALADRLCGRCHVVSQQVGPAFVDIAKGAHASRDALRDFLRGTHSDVSHPNAMPAPELSEQQIDVLAAYIASLHGAH